EDVVVVEIPVQQPVSGCVEEFGHGGGADADQPLFGRVAQGRYGVGCLLEHGGGDAGQPAQAAGGGYRGQPGQEVGQDVDRGGVVGQRGERTGGVQTLQQHGARVRVVVEQ